MPTLTYAHKLWDIAERIRAQREMTEMSSTRIVANCSLTDRVRRLHGRDLASRVPAPPFKERQVKVGSGIIFGHPLVGPPGRYFGQVPEEEDLGYAGGMVTLCRPWSTLGTTPGRTGDVSVEKEV